MKAKAGLAQVVKSECANYDHHYGGCLFDDNCAVLQGRPCDYFEAAVLGKPSYPYRNSNYDWQRVFDQYGLINPRFAARAVQNRRCQCGAILEPRRRYCPRCARQKRLQLKRASERQRRKLRRGQLIENGVHKSLFYNHRSV